METCSTIIYYMAKWRDSHQQRQRDFSHNTALPYTCPSYTLPLITLHPSTNLQSTTLPSTNLPYTILPSTTLPSTTIPSISLRTQNTNHQPTKLLLILHSSLRPTTHHTRNLSNKE
ncbi:hypothetical protein HA466_0105740 [Hirschfeldia incana]|nr:hypothetical protein HA466_0105740 [Hirschfeldia incana]KAJ0254705.1 hypothetical protein HA466_0105740 [Hirschfeldia incana]KAJ0254706.1 hypothetical protein HA466_0105740 [Hirschfeldia incana]